MANRVIFYFNRSFGQELVVFHIKLSMFSKFFGARLESVWRFEQRSFYIDSLGAKLILAPLGMPKGVNLNETDKESSSFKL